MKKINFLDSFHKNTQMTNIMKIRLVGAELFHADRRTDGHDEENSRFSQFCECSWKDLNLFTFPASNLQRTGK